MTQIDEHGYQIMNKSPNGDETKRQVELSECPTCYAGVGCSCIVPDPNAETVTCFDGRHFHRKRVQIFLSAKCGGQ